MLILTRRPGERVVIGEDILVTVMGVSGHTVRLGIAAPEGIPIYREEIWLAVMEENRAAAEANADALPAKPPWTRPRIPERRLIWLCRRYRLATVQGSSLERGSAPPGEADPPSATHVDHEPVAAAHGAPPAGQRGRRHQHAIHARFEGAGGAGGRQECGGALALIARSGRPGVAASSRCARRRSRSSASAARRRAHPEEHGTTSRRSRRPSTRQRATGC